MGESIDIIDYLNLQIKYRESAAEECIQERDDDEGSARHFGAIEALTEIKEWVIRQRNG